MIERQTKPKTGIQKVKNRQPKQTTEKKKKKGDDVDHFWIRPSKWRFVY